jgi:predicted flavoprotein YhiN
MRVAVIGGGAAGFFSAIHVKENHSNTKLLLVSFNNIIT